MPSTPAKWPGSFLATMSGPPQDPALPFSFSKSPSLTPLSGEVTPAPTDKLRHRQSKPFVEAPRLPSLEKNRYRDLPEDFQSEVALDEESLDHVVGDYVVNRKHYYFVRLKDGMVHRFLSKTFKTRYPDFVNDYELKKKKGTLEPFDPSDVSVHLASRITNRIHIKKPSLSSSKSSALDDDGNGEGSTSDQEDFRQSDEFMNEDTEPESESGSDHNDAKSGKVFRRKKPLPFSPKMLRSRRKNTVLDSEDELAGYAEETALDIEIVPTRRSTRIRKTVQPSSTYSSAYEDNEEEDEAEDTKAKPKVRKKKSTPAVSRPAYGHFRSIKCLDYDEYPKTAALRAHYDVCGKCLKEPTHVLLKKYRRRHQPKGKEKKHSLAEEDDDEEKITNKGGWVRCLKCAIAAHWACLAADQRDEILRAARDRDRDIWRQRQQPAGADNPGQVIADTSEPKKRPGLDQSETTEFLCTGCLRGGICMGCRQAALEPDHKYLKRMRLIPTDGQDDQVAPSDVAPPNEDVQMMDGTTSKPGLEESTGELLFRCATCRRLAHYRHLPFPLELQGKTKPVDPVILAEHYQTATKWDCADCTSFRYRVDKILAWRPYLSHVAETRRDPKEALNIKSQLPREYLVKWLDRSYRRVQWVPHMWLATRSYLMLRQFLTNGPKVEMLNEPMPEGQTTPADASCPIGPVFEIGADESREPSVKPTPEPSLPSDPAPDAERRIPPAWKTVDRVLDILLWYPQKRKDKKDKRRRTKDASVAESAGEEEDIRVQAEYAAAFDDGEQPSDNITETIKEFENRVHRKITVEDVDRVIWAFIKWDDLGYDESTWDAPPRPGEFGYTAFKEAFRRFIASRSVIVPIRTGESMALVANRDQGGYKKYCLKDDEQPILGQASNLKLMPFQIDGFNWLCNNWWNLQHCILADEMGLGKTVQIAAFLGQISERWDAWPALVVVPNSTITNWVREFSRWAPALRVVPFYGGAKGREIVKKYELFHDHHAEGTTGAKYHVLITTYDTVTNAKDSAAVFKHVPRWEVLVVDEGQRLKSDSSLLFRKLKELNCIHRIIMTGTPLNNNIRELFNLMNFLDPDEWDDLDALAKEHEVLTEELVKQLHNRLRPYFLRRIKSEVLQLPPKNEVIVPLSMSPLQKNIYRSILSKNFEVLKSLTEESKSRFKATGIKSNLRNMLMQLRKCLQHPYINDRAIEPENLAPEEAHSKLIDASTKLRFLKALLPKLKAHGHRVLLFSQFVIALDVIEDFLSGEGYKFLRLDGDTPQAQRQKGMDEFNRPGSDVFIYILSTRAGGVGINLWSADTVIIHDPDFNPHQDIQAIARSHRYGQTKTCLVFKLMVKDSAEERIIQTGKKKLVLDHLIVQKMDEDESNGENLQSILIYGAQALFEEDHDSKDIIYTDADLDNLIEKTEKEVPKEEAAKEGLFSFSFAKIWAADKDALEEVADDLPQGQEQDSWAHTLQRIEAVVSQEKQKEATGRGVRRRAAAVFPQQFDMPDSPMKDGTKKKRRSKSKSSKASSSEDSEAYVALSEDNDSDISTFSMSVEGAMQDLPLSTHPDPTEVELQPPSSRYKLARSTPSEAMKQLRQDERLSHVNSRLPQRRTDDTSERCGLCASIHPPGQCHMTNMSEYLAEYRLVLMTHSDHEPVERRRAAVRAIDETLSRRGKLHLIAGQPLVIVDKPATTAAISNTSREIAKRRRDDHVPAVHPFFQGQRTKAKERKQENGSVQPPHVQQPAGGPSKRASSPMSREPEMFKKKVKACKLGCGAPKHLQLEDCLVVRSGPTSVSKAIMRHESDPAMAHIVQKLRRILKTQKKAEMIALDPPVERLVIED